MEGPVAEIVDYKILVDGEISSIGQIGFLKNISIYVKVFYKDDILKPRLAISIATPTGILLHGTNTGMKNFFVQPGRKGGVAVYSYSFRNVLAKGSYIFSLWLISEEADGVYRLDTRESAIILESLGTDRFNGLFDMEINISQLSPSSS